jgi:hypothetical protein
MSILKRRYLSTFDRLKYLSRKDAIATLTYLCKISESDFAAQLAAKNPQWGVRVSNGKLLSKNH